MLVVNVHMLDTGLRGYPPLGPYFMVTYQPTPGQVTSCYLAALANPDLCKPSPVSSRFDSQTFEERLEIRTIAYLAEAGMNLAVGNGFLSGLRGVPDVPPNIEVKWNRRGDKLIVSGKYLDPDLIYVLATGRRPVTYLGWLPGRKITRRLAGNGYPQWFAYAGELKQFPASWWAEKLPKNITIGQAMSHPSSYSSTIV